MIPNQVKHTKVWAASIALNERDGDGNTKAAILDACKELDLDPVSAENRYQSAGGSDLSKKEGIFFILTGQPYPGPKGYTWA